MTDRGNQGLCDDLAALLASLQAKDAVAAAEIIERVCGRLATQGPLDARALEQARALIQHCEEASQALREQLTGALATAAVSRRAADAYGGPHNSE